MTGVTASYDSVPLSEDPTMNATSIVDGIEEANSDNKIVISEKESSIEPSSKQSVDPSIGASISSKFFVDDEKGMDSGAAWTVDAASFFVQFFVVGTVFSFGVFMPIYVEAFNAPQSSVAWVGSIGSFIMVAFGLVIGAFDDRYGNSKLILIGAFLSSAGYLLASFSTELWHLYVTQGFISGLGYSACFISAVSIVGQWFKKHRGLAVGIAVAGSGLGQFTISLVLGALINSLGWRTTLQILALVNLVGLITCSALITRRLPTAHHLVIVGNSLEFLQNANFMCLIFGYFIYILGMFVPYTYLVIYAESKGVSRNNAVLILSITGITNAIGRIIIGELADMVGKLNMLKISMICGCISTFCWLSCDNFNSIMVYGVVYGFFGGGAVSLLPSIAADILGVKKISTLVGFLYTFTSPGNLLSTPIAGFMFTAYQSYDSMIILTACFMLAGVSFITFSCVNDKPSTANNVSEKSEISMTTLDPSSIKPSCYSADDTDRIADIESQNKEETTDVSENVIVESQESETDPKPLVL